MLGNNTSEIAGTATFASKTSCDYMRNRNPMQTLQRTKPNKKHFISRSCFKQTVIFDAVLKLIWN
jgi:hypothetical protein